MNARMYTCRHARSASFLCSYTVLDSSQGLDPTPPPTHTVGVSSYFTYIVKMISHSIAQSSILQVTLDCQVDNKCCHTCSFPSTYQLPTCLASIVWAELVLAFIHIFLKPLQSILHSQVSFDQASSYFKSWQLPSI